MKRNILFAVAVAVSMFGAAVCGASAQNRDRSETLLEKWYFRLGDVDQQNIGTGWTEVRVPHDWAISGPFIEKFDEKYAANAKTDEERNWALSTVNVGSLPYVGVGCYYTTVDIEDLSKSYTLEFDGAMSNPHVFINGNGALHWFYGYDSFFGDVTSYLKKGENQILVRLENEPQSSRWYPGAGLYRNVRIIATNKLHVPVWGTYLTTPRVSAEEASVDLKISLQNDSASVSGAPLAVRIKTVIRDEMGREVAKKESATTLYRGAAAEQHFTVEHPVLWSPDEPYLYRAETTVCDRNGVEADFYVTRFGIRKAEFIPDKGFFLNGKKTQFKGVCLHHDLGALGAAVNREALRTRLAMLKDMGCNAIRTSHNMPAPELVELADEMGFMMMVESFDEWDIAKCENGYHKHFAEWAENDMVNMVRHYRNDPSVIMWSIGNEVPSQGTPDGYKTLIFLQDICHREDPSRMVTCGEDNIYAVLHNGFAALLDIPGFNYKPKWYERAYDALPQGFILGTESASTISSRGVYELPWKTGHTILNADRQSSSYDNEYCYWSNLPDYDFAADQDIPYCLGQFVWTGYDYLGEPTPYGDAVKGWPNHSSLFGIIDLAELPKDRFYLYRSVWNTESPTLHIVPHWTWKGHEGKVVPVMVYTSYPAAELFLNGVSQGVRRKLTAAEVGLKNNPDSLMLRYRLIWPDVKYKAGELKVVALDSEGKRADSVTVRTAGNPNSLELKVNKSLLKPDGNDLCYVTVRCIDKNGNLCPLDSREVSVNVTGAGKLEGIANGDPTCLESFKGDRMKLFGGELTCIVRSDGTEGYIQVNATASKVKKGSIALKAENIKKPRR
jgi:beta-galactosidase